MPEFRVLIVEDDLLVADLLESAARRRSAIIVGTASNGTDALRLARETPPDLALLDIKLDGDLDGVGLGHVLREAYGTLIAFITGSVDPNTLRRVDDLQPLALVQKPFRIAQIDALLERARSTPRTRRAL
jgi:DNA-binding response OmpR family regulator